MYKKKTPSFELLALRAEHNTKVPLAKLQNLKAKLCQPLPPGDPRAISMKVAGKSCVHLGFLLGTIVSFCLEGRAHTTTTPWTTAESPSASTHETTTSSPPTRTSSPPTTLAPQETTRDTMQTTTPLKSSSPETSTPSFASASPSEATASSSTASGTGQEQAAPGEDQSKAELCEASNRRLLLICLIVIGVLVFICVCLLVVTVVMASKLSFIKRRQPSKRLPRSNGDFLSASSLWPAGLETLQRMAEESASPNPATSSLGPQRAAAGQGKTGDRVSKMLAGEISDRQRHKELAEQETATTPRSGAITRAEV